MKRMLALLVFIVFVATGCATPHIEGRTAAWCLIVSGATYLLTKNVKLAYAGCVLGGGLGHEFATWEEMNGRTLRPTKKVVVRVRGRAAEKLGIEQLEELGEDENYCEKKYYYSPRLQTECQRGLQEAKREIERIREREAYEDGRRGY